MNKEGRLKNYKKKLELKVEVLYNVVYTHLKFITEYNQKQKDSFYTLVGAQLFYLNKSKEFNYSGKISKNAYIARENKHAITQEHFNPRMLCAKELIEYLQENNTMNNMKAMAVIIDKFIEKWGCYHYTTPAENRELKKQYKKPQSASSNWVEPESWEDAYKRAGIELIEDDSYSLKNN